MESVAYYRVFKEKRSKELDAQKTAVKAYLKKWGVYRPRSIL